MTYTKQFQPKETHSALAMGSGTLEVLATPAVVAFAENACHEAIASELVSEVTTVGINITINHIKASAISQEVSVEVEVTEQTDYGFSFNYLVTVADQLVATGTHRRAIVDIERFLNKIN